ncbi:hypothetical protein MNBD_GAMMA02-1758 [hydrothermal vent metagenome]|uniref:Uncharacterized protein n=1 Tax=hydrothermal vent metagenome TaxID=652676 RepID=A0A3B0W129_9ZZZZ
MGLARKHPIIMSSVVVSEEHFYVVKILSLDSALSIAENGLTSLTASNL